MLSRLLSRYWLLFPLLILVVIAVDRIETPEVIDTEQTIDMRETKSDYYMADFQTRKFNSQGHIEYTVWGDTLAHYPQNNQSRITSPRIELHRENTNWNIRSDNGIFDTDPDLFTLQGDVVVTRQADGSPTMTIRTSTLTVATESNTVSTDELIEINAPSWQLQATGLTSSIDNGKLTLQSDVIGRFEPPSP